MQILSTFKEAIMCCFISTRGMGHLENVVKRVLRTRNLNRPEVSNVSSKLSRITQKHLGTRCHWEAKLLSSQDGGRHP